MSFALRKSTAGQVVQFKMVDSTTGLKKTGLTIANTDIKLIFDDGTTQTSKNSGGATEIGSTGVYYMTLDATDSATLGRLRIDIEVAGALPWFVDLMVMTALTWDAFYAASGGSIFADVQTIKTQAVTCSAGVTVGAFVGNATAALAVDASGRVDLGKILGTASAGAVGYVGVDWSHVNAPTTTVALTGTTIALTSAYDFAKGTVAVTEAYNADGAAPTPVQALMLILQMLTEKSISSTTLTVKKLDGSTTAATFTLNDATTPTAITRAT